MTSIIIPILTYGLESFPMSEENYLHIDTFVSKALNQTQTTSDMESETQEIQDNSYWIMFENDLTPPSLLVKRNKISIYTKSIRNVQGLNLSLLSSFKTNFLIEEIKQIEQEWSFTIKDLLLNYKGEKLVPKDQIKELLNQAIETYSETFLETTNWDSTTEGQQPTRLPDTINKPNIKLLNMTGSIKHTPKSNLQPMQWKIPIDFPSQPK